MTVSSTLEAKLRGRAPSSAPARATAKVLGIKEFEDDLAQARFNDLSHWGYGTGWGVVRGLLGATGLSPRRGDRAPTAPPSGAPRRSRCPRSRSRRRSIFWAQAGDRHRRVPPTWAPAGSLRP